MRDALSATILSVTGPCDFSCRKGHHEQLRRNRWSERATNTTSRKAHLVLHCLSMHAETITASLLCHSCLDGLPIKRDFAFCHNRNSKQPRFKRTRWEAVAELHEILQARGDPCHVNLASVSLFCYKVPSACGENARRQTATVWYIWERMSRTGRDGFEQATNDFTNLQIQSS